MKKNTIIDPKLNLDEEKLEQELLTGEYESDQNAESKAMWSEAIKKVAIRV